MKFRFDAVIMVLMFNILSFGLLCCYPDADSIKLLSAMGIICAVILITYALIYALGLGDPYPFLMVAMLSSMSIIILYSLAIQQSAEYDNPQKSLIAIADNQLKWFLAGTAVFYISYFFYRIIKVWHKLSFIYIGLTIILFAVTLILAPTLGGARNWIEIAGVGIQPSEVTKLCFLFAVSSLVCTKKALSGFRMRVYALSKEDIIITVYVYICLVMFLLQGELGTAVLFFFVYFAMMVAYQVPLVLPLGNALAVALGVMAVFAIGDRVSAFGRALERVSIWLDPEVFRFEPELGKPQGTQQIFESLRAICSGGYFGTGLGLSGAHDIWVIESDLVFSAICYEMGIFMGIAIIMIYFILVYRGCKIAMEVKAPFDRALALSIIAGIAGQSFIIIGGVTKMIPLTGITMPFVSAGGSSMIVSFAMLGILTAISNKREKRSF